ncbi:UNKNOWN [Stylonychia lemnae]|uniref:Uncharacterized protein n=1 Tax=Stylonychia lemnae TaxID=5949 RepID=A0A077ZNZ4_STYLE|nr:UNKNOWN [Stylonychia lemnae]|eukprot:CDW71633.1 UNKNOWN [Stylonychia lemnae]
MLQNDQQFILVFIPDNKQDSLHQLQSENPIVQKTPKGLQNAVRLNQLSVINLFMNGIAMFMMIVVATQTAYFYPWLYVVEDMCFNKNCGLHSLLFAIQNLATYSLLSTPMNFYIYRVSSQNQVELKEDVSTLKLVSAGFVLTYIILIFPLPFYSYFFTYSNTASFFNLTFGFDFLFIALIIWESVIFFLASFNA